MNTAAKELNFEEAAKLRDQVKHLRQKMIGQK
jgi:protein-arginine kinase activator protein McsA